MYLVPEFLRNKGVDLTYMRKKELKFLHIVKYKFIRVGFNKANNIPFIEDNSFFQMNNVSDQYIARFNDPWGFFIHAITNCDRFELVYEFLIALIMQRVNKIM